MARWSISRWWQALRRWRHYGRAVRLLRVGLFVGVLLLFLYRFSQIGWQEVARARLSSLRGRRVCRRMGAENQHTSTRALQM